MFAASLLLLTTAASAQYYDVDYVMLNCPVEASLEADSFGVQIWVANDRTLGGFSFGFSYNTDQFDVTNATATPALTIPGGFSSFLVNYQPRITGF